MKKILLATLLIFPSTLFAKDMTHRLGVGYANESGANVPSLHAKYFMSPDLAFSTDLGIQTGDSNSAFSLLAKVYKTIFPEDNMNFYISGGAGLVSQKISTTLGGDGKNNSGYELMTTVGVELFVPGLDSVGISFEAGIGILSIRSSTTFRTVADSPLSAGMVFYF